MQKDTRNKLALIATVTLVPGGLLLGTALLVNHYRKKAAQKQADEADAEDGSDTPEQA